MGATQLSLLFALGLRDRHKLLDLGCGSLRAGRLLIPYLSRGCYFGLEPNRWLVEDAIERQLGRDILRVKEPRFLHHDTFTCAEFGEEFDYILVQSIFSHCGADLLAQILAELSRVLAPNGIVAATFVEGADAEAESSGWVYPDSVSYTKNEIADQISRCGLFCKRLRWYHPRQRWYVLARSVERLPTLAQAEALHGMVLFAPEFRESDPTVRE